MLVLSRGKRERIQIGNDVVVSIIDVCGKKVKVGIEAPKSVNVIRLPGLLEVEVRTDGELAK